MPPVKVDMVDGSNTVFSIDFTEMYFFGVHPLRKTTTSSSTLKTQHEEEESMC